MEYSDYFISWNLSSWCSCCCFFLSFLFNIHVLNSYYYCPGMCPQESRARNTSTSRAPTPLLHILQERRSSAVVPILSILSRASSITTITIILSPSTSTSSMVIHDNSSPYCHNPYPLVMIKQRRSIMLGCILLVLLNAALPSSHHH